jgi:KTSC domain
MMEYKIIESSSIRCIGYDAETKELEVMFCSGGRYAYSGVPKAKADALLNAQSRGVFFATEIRPNYPFRCLERAPKKEAASAAEPQKSEKQAATARKTRKIQAI